MLTRLTVISLFICLSATITSAQNLPANFQDSLVSGGWTQAEGLTFDSTGQMYVWEKDGYVWVVDTNGNKIATPLLDIRQEVGSWRDHGLNGFALDPNFRTNGYYYCFYTVDRNHLMYFGTGLYNASADSFYNATIARVTRYTANAATNFTTTVSNSRLVLIGENKKNGIPVLYESHSGGQLVFGDDGTLLISTGDGASYAAYDSGSIAHTYYVQALADSIITAKENVGAFRSQLIDCLSGKILRINPATGNGIASNPYYDAASPRAARSRVWALGLRNPFRMCKRPGTGNTDPSAGDPGTLYIGDVGFETFEDINVCNAPNQNFGWPNYEGLEAVPIFNTTTTKNMDAPNPLFGVGGCTRQHLYFKELIKQPTKNGVISFPITTCNGQTGSVPANVPHWAHTRPTVDYKHGAVQARTGAWNGNNASSVDIGSGGSPVSGSGFEGYCAIAGVWYNGSAYPVMYQNKYFHADFSTNWIKYFNYNSLDTPTSVSTFTDSIPSIVCMAINPKDQFIWYLKYPDQVRKLKYGIVLNNFPTAVATQSVVYGASPLIVNFTGSQSSDPEGQPLTYSWNFGDGTALVTSQNTLHTFTVASGIPTTYTVALTVTDNVLQSNTTTLKVFVNNTPPQITITSPVNNSYYTMASNSNIMCTASVIDLEHTAAQLSYQWQTILHHNNHEHPEPVDNNTITATTLSPVGCDGDTYYYEQKLTVTDAAGLSATASSLIYPACTAPAAAFSANNTSVCTGTSINFTDQSSSLADNYSWTFGGGTPSSSTLKNPTVTYNNAGTYSVTLTVSNIWGSNTLTKTGYITVGTLNPAITPAGPVIICEGSATTLTAPTGAGFTYQWKLNGTNISGATSSTYTVSTNGNYSCLVNAGTCASTSNVVVINKINNPNPSVTYSTPLTFCSPGSVTFTANTFAGVSYQWQKNSVDIAGATNQTYVASTTGKYRVKETANGCTKQGMDVQVNVNATSISAAISANGPTSFCSGGSVVLSVDNAIPGYGFQWKNNGINISGATNNAYTATGSGIYTCLISASCGSATSNSITVSTSGIAAIVSPSGSVSVCNGATVSFTANTGTGYSHQWKNNGVNISGATNASYNATSAGNYSVAITSPCGNSTSAATAVTISTLSASSSPSSITICEGQATTFTANTGYNYSYQWLRNNAVISGATFSSYATSQAATYKVVITQGGVCSATSPTSTLIVTNNPKPTITAGGPTTFCAGQSVTLTANTFAGVVYQWQKNSTNIAGGTAQNYVANATGQYRVIETANGCSKTAAAVQVTVNCRSDLAESNTQENEIKVMPNPFNNEFMVYGFQFSTGDKIEMIDVLGNVALVYALNAATENCKLQTTNISAGVYFLQVVTPREKKIIKLVKTSF